MMTWIRHHLLDSTITDDPATAVDTAISCRWFEGEGT